MGEAHRAGWRCKVRCAFGRHDGMKYIRGCVFSAELDVQTLVCTKGPNYPIDVLPHRLICPKCGSRRVAVYWIPPSGVWEIHGKAGAAG